MRGSEGGGVSQRGGRCCHARDVLRDYHSETSHVFRSSRRKVTRDTFSKVEPRDKNGLSPIRVTDESKKGD